VGCGRPARRALGQGTAGREIQIQIIGARCRQGER
jgi:hypothetical protein